MKNQKVDKADRVVVREEVDSGLLEDMWIEFIHRL
jgi:hypothetical protein